MFEDSPLAGAFNKIRSPLRNRLRGKKLKRFPSEVFSQGGTAYSPAQLDSNMGKSNKFDYTNRANSGAKLGQIIGAALQKESEKIKKDAEKNMQKARKQSTDSTGPSCDTYSTKHLLDLKAPGKELGDEGVFALADSLETALMGGNSVASLGLEDLNLSGNGMTTMSVARLAPIIEMAKCDLKTINLAGNKICVETDKQAQEWETFLKSFRGCLKLRRLDFSGNPQLGSRALEILVRVHTNEPPISPIAAGGETSVLSLVSEADEDVTEADEGIAFEDEAMSGRPGMTAGQLMKRRCGLRSIPYITVNDIGLDDAGALWLSYIMTDHYYPNQLLDELNATHAESAIKTYQQDNNSEGVDWAENTTLGKEGKNLLEKAETLRRQILLDDAATIASIVEDQEVLRRSVDRRHSKAAARDRRFSIRSIRTEDGGEHEATEMESLQRKIQRHIIEHDGPHSVDLWKAALKVFKASRMILYSTSATRRYYIGPPTFDMPDLETSASITIQPPSPADSPFMQPVRFSNDTPKQSYQSYAAKLAGTTQGSADVPESPLTEVTNTPVTPMLMQRHTHRHDAFSEGTDLHTVTDKLNGLLVDSGSPDRFVIYQQRRIVAAEHSFRDTHVPCHLPLHLLKYIISFTIAGQEMNVLSGKQMEIAIERGQDVDTLMVEREWLKRDESAQLWMLLDSIRCLAYGME